MAINTATTISITELAGHLSEILARVRVHGERFTIERDGMPIATLKPPTGPVVVRLRDVIERIGDLHMPGDGFADALEEIQASQPTLPEPPEWPR